MEFAGRNITEIVEPSKATRREAKALSVEETQRLLEATRADRFGPLFTFALATGLRRGSRWRSAGKRSISRVRRSRSEPVRAMPSAKRPRRRPQRPDADRRTLRACDRRATRTEGAAGAGSARRRPHLPSTRLCVRRRARRHAPSARSHLGVHAHVEAAMIGARRGHPDRRFRARSSSRTVTLTTYARLIAGAQAKAVATVEDRLSERS